MNYAELDSYLQNLCVKHKQLLHDDINNLVYVPLLSDMEVGSIDSNQAKKLVIFENIAATPAGTADDIKYIQEVTLSFLAHKDSASDIKEETKLQLSTMFSIMMDFLGRMRVDHSLMDCAALRGMHTAAFWKVIEDEMIVNSVGWELKLKFTINEPAYNAANWNA